MALSKLKYEDVEELFETSNRQIREESSDFHRYLMSEIDWRDKLICIKGARGVGKTTLMRQRMKAAHRELDTGRDQGLKMLKALERAGLLALVDSRGLKLDSLSKPEKIYCGNTNLMHALVPRVNEGVSRETYFYNQVSKDHVVTYTGVGDFVVDGKWTFEVGGKSKGFSQIADLPNSYVINDDTAVGRGNRIPLWLFGFLY